MRPLVVNALHKSYGALNAIKDVSFSVDTGSCVGLLGPNGAGKTTVLQICLGLVTADKGSVRVFDMDMPSKALAARQRLGVVPQNNILDPDFNCIENLLVFGRYFGLDKKEIQARIPYLLEFASLTQRSNELITNLSGGMQRRLTLARALINDPDMIFLDEPTTGLDPQARHLIWERLHQLQEQNKTLLLVTHFMEEAERLCEYIHIMDNGQIIASGTPKNLLREHSESEVVELQGAESIRWLESNGKLFSRHERFGTVSYCYSNDATPALKALGDTSLQFTHRPANLEDVFLVLTGRALKE